MYYGVYHPYQNDKGKGKNLTPLVKAAANQEDLNHHCRHTTLCKATSDNNFNSRFFRSHTLTTP